MTVVSVTALTVKPDRYEDFLAMTRKTKAIMERCGAKNIRLLAGITAGEASGTLALSAEYDDFTDAGRALDKFLADAEGLALMTQSNSAAGPTASWQGSSWIEVPL